MMDLLSNILKSTEPYLDILGLIIGLIISFVIFSTILKLVEKKLLGKVKTKKQVSNIAVFINLLKYLFVLLLAVVAISSQYGTWGELGFITGLLTVALGWALQKPISGVVAWLILITRRPFLIGDRIDISGAKGDITNVTLTHIFLDEVGGTIDGDEKSGRTIMIPTSVIFEQEIINYTEKDDYILDEIVTTITYESNLEKAENIIITAASTIMSPLWNTFPKKIPKEPYTRLVFKDSGINITVRYYTIATKKNKISTDITREIFNQIRKTNDVEIAYPHTEVLLREKSN